VTVQAHRSQTVNVAARLAAVAAAMPDSVAIAEPVGRATDGRRRYRSVTFAELEEDTDRIAHGLRRMGVEQGIRLALLVRPGIDFVALVFGMLKSGAVAILIDPGMGRRNLLVCLDEAEPEGFVAVPEVHAARCLFRRRYARAKLNLTVGSRWFWGGATLAQLRRAPVGDEHLPATQAEDPAAIIFTTGSTGPPKGVLYCHGNFDAQVAEIRDFYGIQPGEIDLPGFPLFGLFNCAMGVTTVIPDMDPSRPARVDPRNIIEAVGDWHVTQAFGSPAIWNCVGTYCVSRGVRLPSLKRVLSAGAPVPPSVLDRMMASIADDGEMHTPYGATEALPVSSIGAREVLSETAFLSRQGAGTCVGRPFPGIDWQVVRIVDGPIAGLDETEPLGEGEIGELLVRGPVVTRRYVTRPESNALAKIIDGESVWHRMGDAGYLDDQGRFWFCGRVAHRVLTRDGPMYTIPCEAIYNEHPAVFRSALVGIGPTGDQRPVIIVEPFADHRPTNEAARQRLIGELRELGRSHPKTDRIDGVLLHPAFPVDIRHNAKIFREKLAVWATGKIQPPCA